MLLLSCCWATLQRTDKRYQVLLLIRAQIVKVRSNSCRFFAMPGNRLLNSERFSIMHVTVPLMDAPEGGRPQSMRSALNHESES